MATRSIARTAIEGGRTSRWEEHHHTRIERRWHRVALQQIARDPELADEVNVPRRLGAWYWGTDFADRLNPVKRWLEGRVGRRWDDVYSEIRQTFDFRTTAGRHIVGHIKSFVTMPWEVERYSWDRHSRYPGLFPGELHVDDAGILQQAPFMDRRKWYRRS